MQFGWMGWYLLGLGVGAFLWESTTLGLCLGALAVACYVFGRIAERQSWDHFLNNPDDREDDR